MREYMKKLSKADREKEEILDPERARKRKEQHKRNRILCVLSVIAAILAVGVGGFSVLKVMGKNKLAKNAIVASPSPTIEDSTLTEEEKTYWQEGWVRYEGKIYDYNEDILTFLVMGIDKNTDAKEVEEGTKGGQADALFLVVLNPHTSQISVIGINRNAMTDIDIYDNAGAYVRTQVAQICVQHGFGNGVEESCEYQVKAVSNLMYNIPIHGYGAINMKGIPTINDAVRGVDVTVLEDITAVDASLIKGEEVHLEGQSSYWYVKYRDTSIFQSADARLARQKQYLSAFITQAKEATKKDITVPVKLYQAMQTMMVTNITVDEVAYLSSIAVDYSFAEDSFHMVPGETQMGEQFEEFYVDEDALYQMIIDVFYEEVEGVQ